MPWNVIRTSKLLNLLLVLTSLTGYLEWGKGNRLFLFQAELEIIQKVFTDPLSVLHPFILLPLAGQLLLLYSLFQKIPGKTLTLIGLASTGLLLFFMFFIGCLSANGRIMGSALPFMVVAVVTIVHHFKRRKES